MADYYSLLARAVANLPKTSPPSSRRAIYERARKALTNQLRSLKPQLPESDIAREERALDEAVARLEADFEPAIADVQALPLSAGSAQDLAPPPPAPRPIEAPVARVASPQVRPAAPTPLIRPRPPTPRAPTPAAAATAPGLPSAMALKAPLRGPVEAPPPPPAPIEPPTAPPAPVEVAAAFEAPSLGGGAANRQEREPARPILSDAPKRKAATWLWAGGAVALGFAAVIAVAAYVMRPALQDLTAPTAIDSPVAEPTETPEKSLSRVGEATPTAAPAPSAAPTAPPSAAAAGAPAPSPEATAAAAPAPSVASPIATPTPSAAPTAEPATGAQPTVAIASRAAMLVATVADAAKPAISVGTAVWTLVPAPAGQPQGIGVKAEVDIPDLKLHASMIMRKNFDASLPASHTVDLRVTFEPGSSIKGVKDIALPLMRRDDPPAADALAGVRVKISDNYFLIGLNREAADVTKNIQEIGERGWFDFPMQLDDDRIAKLTFEKGADGEKIVAQALAAWK